MSTLFRNKSDQQKLLTTLDELLRIDPVRNGLLVDEFGSAVLDDVTLAASASIPWVTRLHIEELAHNPHNRLIVTADRIGFSGGQHFPVITPSVVTPPVLLYLATNQLLVNTWKHGAAKPLFKRYLSLYTNSDEAWHFATAKDNIVSPVILEVQALAAHKSGIIFFQFERTYYVVAIPSNFIVF
jgi:RNA:NAD 2'-phosphotransferase (TPT1/KptA family)